MNMDNIDDFRVIKCTVNHLANGKTILEYLSKRFTYHDEKTWQSEIDEGRIKLNEQNITAEITVKCGDQISYLPENVVEPDVDFNYKIVFEDDYILVIDKPGNLPTHPAGIYLQNTLWFQLRKVYGPVFPVNRLDLETSGLLIFTKESKLSGLFAKEKMHKSYFALVHGEFKGNLQADGFLFRDMNSIVRKRRKFSFEQVEDIDKKLNVETCKTYLEAVKTNGRFTLIKATLGSGRTHQIRATLSSLGFPIVGDKIYGLDDNFFLRRKEDRLTKEDWEHLILKRQALHSHHLVFKHVVTDQIIDLKSEIPIEFKNLID